MSAAALTIPKTVKLARQPSGDADDQGRQMDSREPPTNGSAGEPRDDSDTELLLALAAVYEAQAADAMRRHALLGSDPNPKAVCVRIRCIRDAINFKRKEIRLLQRAGLLRRSGSNSD